MSTREVTVRLQFEKVGVQRFLSHLDLMRLFRKAFRRAFLPLKTSRGKSPRARINIPYPLPVGVETDRDILEADLEYPVHPDVVVERLNRNLPEGVTVFTAWHVSAGDRQTLKGVRYDAEGEGLPDGNRLDEFMTSTTWTVERKKNDRLVSLNIRPFVKALQRADDGRVTLELKVVEGRSTRPDEVLRTLGLDDSTIAALRIRRTGIVECRP